MSEAAQTAAAEPLKVEIPPVPVPAIGQYEIVSHAVIDTRFVVMVRAPSGRHYVGNVSGWTEVPGPQVQP